jgi:hypothetical protein
MSAFGNRALPRRLPLLALILLLPLLAQGCWTLESYVARVRIEADGSYKYVLEGSALHTATAFAVRRVDHEIRTGKFKPEDAKKMRAEAEAGLAKDLEAARQDPRVQNITPVGGGRVRFTVVGKASIAGGEIVFQQRDVPLAYAQTPEGALSVRLKDTVVGRNAELLGLKVVGDASITLAEGIPVLKHNAERTPTVPGGAYRWHLEGQAPVPQLVLRLPKR